MIRALSSLWDCAGTVPVPLAAIGGASLTPAAVASARIAFCAAPGNPPAAGLIGTLFSRAYAAAAVWPVEAVAVWHHHQQSLLVRARELDSEEASVDAGPMPELCDRAEVVLVGDDRHPDRETRAVRIADDGQQLPLCGRQQRRLGCQKHLFGYEVIAGRITVRTGDRRQRTAD
jgi:hypothetical protein